MSAAQLPMAGPAAPPAAPVRDEDWLLAAKRARQLSWASLVWMRVSRASSACSPASRPTR
jgi:hypothetical protein